MTFREFRLRNGLVEDRDVLTLWKANIENDDVPKLFQEYPYITEPVPLEAWRIVTPDVDCLMRMNAASASTLDAQTSTQGAQTPMDTQTSLDTQTTLDTQTSTLNVQTSLDTLTSTLNMQGMQDTQTSTQDASLDTQTSTLDTQTSLGRPSLKRSQPLPDDSSQDMQDMQIFTEDSQNFMDDTQPQ